MRKAQARFTDDTKIYTLFDVRHSDVFRDTDGSGGVKEWYTVTFPLDKAKQNNSGYAQFIRAGQERAKAGKSTENCVIRVFGRQYFATYDC